MDDQTRYHFVACHRADELRMPGIAQLNVQNEWGFVFFEQSCEQINSTNRKCVWTD